MARDEVQGFARALQTSLRRSRLSTGAALVESSSILSVVHSLRTACLLSSLTASHSSLVALQDALRWWAQHGPQQDDGCGHRKKDYRVAIVVHKASQQLLVVNKLLFLQRLSDPARRELFYAVDGVYKEEEQDRMQERMPASLGALLSAMQAHLSNLATPPDNGLAPIITLGTPRLAGVALAGWLLDYEVVYHFSRVQEDAKVPLARSWSSNEAWESEEAADGNDEQVSNCLANKPLHLVVVSLAHQPMPLYQFTFPDSSMARLAKKLSVTGAVDADSICKTIRAQLLQKRGVDVQVRHERVTMDRIAL